MPEVSASMPPPNSAENRAQSTQNPSVVDPTKQTTRSPVTAPFQIKGMQERDRWLKMLVYAKHGGGKTELLGSAIDCVQMRDVIMVDAESGDLTLMDSERIKNANLIHHVPVSTFKQVAYIQEFLTAYCAARDNPNKAAGLLSMKKLYSQVTGIPVEEITNPPVYRTVIVDTLSEVEAYCTYQVLNVDEDKVLKEDGGMDVAGWPEFRKNFEMVKLIIRAFRNLPMNVLFACSEAYTKDENNRFHYTPYLTGKLATQVQGFVDIVGRVVVSQTPNEDGSYPRRVYIHPNVDGQKFDAKSRFSSFKPAFFEDPTMETILKDLNLYREDFNKA